MRHTAIHLLVCLLALVGTACGGMADPLGPDGVDESLGEVVSGEVSSAIAPLASGDVEQFGCGEAFTVGAPDGTMRLSLWSGGGYGDLPDQGDHELGGAWTGQLVTGSDLFAQWCDDVMEPDEPEVVEEASFEVTGTLDWQLVEGDGQCPSVATATLTDAAVVTDGGPVDLPDVEFRNEFFGCVAG